MLRPLRSLRLQTTQWLQVPKIAAACPWTAVRAATGVCCETGSAMPFPSEAVPLAFLDGDSLERTDAGLLWADFVLI